MRLVRLSSLRLPPWRLTVVYGRTTSPRPALSMYGTSARLRMIFLWPWLTRLLTLSFSSSSASPNVILPFRSSTTTSPTLRSSICMETLPNYACELNIPARRAVPCARDCDLESRREKIDQWSLDAPSARELAGLEAFLAEHGAPLRRLEGDRRLLAARRARRDGFHPFPRHAGAGRTGRAFAFAGF